MCRRVGLAMAACAWLFAGWAAAQKTVQESGLRSCFEANGTEIVCAGTGQDGDLRPGSEWPVPRLIDNGDGTVTDRLTDLMWLRDAGCIDGVDWPLALIFADLLADGTDFGCSGYAPGTFDDWRVPSVVELATLIDYGSTTGLPAGHPFVDAGLGGCFTWSSTTNFGDETEAWVVAHGTASPAPPVERMAKTVITGCLWAVRDASAPAGGEVSLSLADGGLRFADGSTQATAVSLSAAAPRRSGQVDCWDSAGDPVGCAGTGQDGELLPGVEWPVPRYTDNSDGTVTDELTGLVWLQEVGCLGTGNTFVEAAAAVADFNAGTEFGCAGYTAGTFDDWRVPGITELTSLLDYGTASGMPAGHPFDFTGITACGFWSSTSNLGSATEAWRSIHGPLAVDRVVERVTKAMEQCVWLVRK